MSLVNLTLGIGAAMQDGITLILSRISGRADVISIEPQSREA